MCAFWAGEFVNSYVLARMKEEGVITEAQLGEAMTQRITEDTPLPTELAEMLGLAMSGAAQVMARTWLAHGAHFTKEVAAQAAGHLAWRGLGSFPVNRMGTGDDPGTSAVGRG